VIMSDTLKKNHLGCYGNKDIHIPIEKLMPEGRYIAASSYSITRAIPPENFLDMIETVHTYGRY